MRCRSRIFIYLVTLLNFFGFFSLISTLSMIKAPMANQFKLSPLFLGIMDASIFLGGIIGTILIVFIPVKHAVYQVFIYSIVAILSLSIQMFAQSFMFLKSFILITSRLCFGFSFNILILMQSIVSYYFHLQSDQKLIRIWYTFAFVGDMSGLILGKIFMDYFNLNWKVFLVFMLCTVAIFSVLLYYCINEVVIQQNNSQENNVRQLLNYFRDPLCAIHSISFITIVCLFDLMILWLPYYFVNIGLKQYAANISIFFALAFCIGNLISEPLQQKFKSYIGLIFLASMVLCNVSSIFLCSLSSGQNDKFAYLLFSFLTSFSMAGYISYTSTTDLRNRTSTKREYLNVNTFNRFFVRIMQLIFSLLSGFLMNSDQKIFIKIFVFASVFNTILIAVRMYCYPKSYDIKKEEVKYLQEELL